MEKVQDQACLVITGVIQGTSREPVYDEHFFHIEWTNRMILNLGLGMLDQLKIYCNYKKENSLICVCDPLVLKLIKCLTLQFSHL